MPKKFLFLFILFFLVVTGIVVLFFINNRYLALPSHPALFSKQTPQPIPTHSLFFSPKNMLVTPGQKNTITIVLTLDEHETTKSLKIIQMEIAYDPTALSDVVVQPGDLFTNSSLLLNIVNSKIGRISYAFEVKQDASPKKTGTAAIITFTPLPSFSGGETNLSFLPKTTIKEQTEITPMIQTREANLIFVSSEQK